MRGVPPLVVPMPCVDGVSQDRCADPVVPLEPLGTELDCPGVGAGAGPVPSGMRVSVEPVPGVPEFDGKLND